MQDVLPFDVKAIQANLDQAENNIKLKDIQIIESDDEKD